MADWPDAAMVKRRLGITSDIWDDDVDLALAAAKEQVQIDVGEAVSVPTASLASAALVLVAMIYKAPDAPYGVAAVFDMGGMRVAANHPTYQRLLVGSRVSFPVG